MALAGPTVSDEVMYLEEARSIGEKPTGKCGWADSNPDSKTHEKPADGPVGHPKNGPE